MNKTNRFGIEPLLEEYLNPARASKYGMDVQKAIFEFIGKPRQMSEEAFSYFTDWFVFEYVMQNGMRVIERFAKENPLSLPSELIELYRDIAEDNRYDFFEVAHADKVSLRLTCIRDGQTYDALLQGKVHQAKSHDVIVCRIGRARNEWHVLTDSLGLPNPSKKDREQMLVMFPVPNPKLTYEEIVAPEMANSMMGMQAKQISDGTMILTGGEAHGDDGCPVCVCMRKAKEEGPSPTQTEIMQAFEEANLQERNGN